MNKEHYIAPQLTVVSIKVEHGFQASGSSIPPANTFRLLWGQFSVNSTQEAWESPDEELFNSWN